MIHRFSVIGISVILVCGVVNAVDPDEQAVKSANIAAVGFAANRQAFPYYACRYVVTRSQAGSVKAALAGERTNQVSAEHRLTLDENREVFECFAEQPDLSKIDTKLKKDITIVSVPFMPMSLLINGTKGVQHSPVIASANLYADSKPAPSVETTP